MVSTCAVKMVDVNTIFIRVAKHARGTYRQFSHETPNPALGKLTDQKARLPGAARNDLLMIIT